MTRSLPRITILVALAGGAVWAQPTITTTSPLPAATVGMAYSQTFAATEGGGDCTCTWSATGLPAWLSMSTSGVLSGMPPSTAVDSTFMVTATDSSDNSTSGSFSLPVALTITTPSPLPAGTVGVDYSQTLAAVGGSGQYTWSLAAGSSLPAGLALAAASGTISGQPTAAGPSSFTVQVSDSNTATATMSFSLTINPALVIQTASPLPTGTVGITYSQILTATGGSGQYTWSLANGSSLPGGLTLTAATGAIGGQPAAAGPGSFTIQVTDSNQVTASKTFTITIDPALVIQTASPLASGTVGVNYSQTLMATGGSGQYTWALASGSTLPGGLTLTPATGIISGQPATAGPASFTIQVTDSNQASVSKTFALTINPALAIQTASPLPAATAGASYSETLTATGGSGQYTWSLATGSSLPAGLTLTAATGAISGQPATAGQSSFTIQVTDTNQVTVSKTFAITVNPALSITTSSPLPAATVGVNYSQTLTASGGSGQYTWSLAAGSSLPGGLTLTSDTGVIGGQPTAAGQSSFTIQVTDSNQVSTNKVFALTVNPALVIQTNSPLPPATVGVSYSQPLTATGGSGQYTWSLAAGSSLPAGLTLAPATGVIAGQPTAAGPASFIVQVTDTNQATTAKTFALTIDAQLTITTSSPLANGIFGVPYNQTLTGSGGLTPYTWSLVPGSGALPGGLTLGSSSGAISGQPTTPGTFPFTVQLSDSSTPTNTVTKSFVITISKGLTITTPAALPNATVGVPYAETLVAAGPPMPYTWKITSGGLPSTLSLNLSTGAITGTPAATATASFTATVTDSVGNTASEAFTLTIVNKPVITTRSPLPNGTPGVSYLQALSVSGGTPPFKWTISSGSLPAGLSLSATAGTITGTPSSSGTSNFTVLLTDSTQVTASQTFSLSIITAVTISTASPLPMGEAGVTYAKTLTAAGGTSPYTWSVAGGSLPPGVTLAANGSLSGTPGTAGTFNFTVQASDVNHATASASLSLTIAGALAISTAATLDSGSVNSSYSQGLMASAGAPPYTWTVIAGALPAGLSLAADGAISGTPSVSGTFSFTAKATDSLGGTASRTFSIVIVNGFTITTPATLPNTNVGATYTADLQATGGVTPYVWTTSKGSLPPGLILQANGDLTGTPTTAGTYTFTIQVTDSHSNQASQQFSLTVAATPSITTTTLPGGSLGVAYSQSLAVAGGTPPYTWSLSTGALPGGLSLSSGGAIAGTPTSAGTFPFSVKVTDSTGVSATQRLSITVSGGLSITTAASLPNASVGAGYSQTLAASGGTPPYSWTLTGGALPAGLTLSPSGAITGTPSGSGTFTFTATVNDSAAGSASQQFTLIVPAGLSITNSSLAGGKVGVSYNQTLTATGGTAPYTFKTTGGSLPPGIMLQGATISGTPTTSGSYTFTIQVTDSASATAGHQFTIVIGGVTITTANLPSAALGTAYSLTLAASGTAPYTWSVTQGALPAGLSLDKSTGTISGTPTAAGASNVTIQVTDSANATASAVFTIKVISASFTGLASTAASAQQLNGSLSIGAAYPEEITGQITLAFQAAASVAAPANDPSIQFSTGGSTAAFTIPANSTAPIPFSLQTGTVAGTITLSVTWQSAGVTLAVPSALSQTIQMSPAAPVISAVSATNTSGGFQVQVMAYSNTRELTQAVVQFTPASGQSLQTTSLTVSLTGASPSWFQNSNSDQYGGQFTLTLPFTVTNGSASAIGSISVQLTNSQGTSTSSSATL